MYLFYVDETNNLDPEVNTLRDDGTRIEKDWLYVITDGLKVFPENSPVTEWIKIL